MQKNESPKNHQKKKRDESPNMKVGNLVYCKVQTSDKKTRVLFFFFTNPRLVFYSFSMDGF
jgi:exosome complex RNA-binding protein Rrp4